MKSYTPTIGKTLAFYDEEDSGPTFHSECGPGKKLACCFTHITLLDEIWQNLRRCYWKLARA